MNNYSMLGLDLGTHRMKVSQLKKDKKGLILNRYGFMDTPEGAVVDGKILDPEIIATRLKVLLRKKRFKGNKVITSVSGENVIIRNLTLPKMTRKELKEAMQYEAEKHIMMPLEEVIYDTYYLRSVSEEEMEILLVAVPREIIDGYMEVLEKAGLYPMVIEVDAFALIRTFRSFFKTWDNKENLEGDESIILLDIGAETSNMVIVEGADYSFSRTLPLGSNHFTRKVMEAENLSIDKVEHLKTNLDFFNLDAAVEAGMDFVKEIQRTIEYFLYKMNNREKHITNIFTMGGGAGIARLDGYIASELNVDVQPLNMMQFLRHDRRIIRIDLEEEQKFLTTSVGLALRGWKDATD